MVPSNVRHSGEVSAGVANKSPNVYETRETQHMMQLDHISVKSQPGQYINIVMR
jgi:hypothetical protein